jgi:hypothetical protein
MNYWIFIAAPHNEGSESYTAKEIYERRMQDQFWGLGARTSNRRNIRKGDQIVFYIARPESAFVGTARLASDCFELNDEEKLKLSHGSRFFTAEYGVMLDKIVSWEKSRRVEALAPNLKFVKDPAQWWAYLQGGIRQVEETDFGVITSSFAIAEPSIRESEEIAAQNLFALESHLEEFIAHNWSKISWGTNLKLFSEGEQTGRQFPAGTWSIDFLAVDLNTNELVVIELKRGQTSDASVGQVLRYINWVRENVATRDQKVRGIIVASGIDAALRYAARGLPDVSVKTYTVTFSLQAETL